MANHGPGRQVVEIHKLFARFQKPLGNCELCSLTAGHVSSKCLEFHQHSPVTWLFILIISVWESELISIQYWVCLKVQLAKHGGLEDSQMETIKGPLVRRSLEATGSVKGLAKSHPPPIFWGKRKFYWNIAIPTHLLSMTVFTCYHSRGV